MEHIHSEKQEAKNTIFKETSNREVQLFLERYKVTSDDFFEVANIVSTYPDELYSRYHNLFSLKQETSCNYIESFINSDTIALGGEDLETYEIDRLKRKIEIAHTFLKFVRKYGWQNGFNAVHLLENVLKS